MAPKIASRITKRSLGRYDDQSDNNEAGILRFYDDQSLHASISGAKDTLLSTETNRQIQPRKRKQGKCILSKFELLISFNNVG